MLEVIKKYVSKPIFVLQKRFSKNLLLFMKLKPILTLDKPIYVGFSIHDLRKLLLYEFHHKSIKIKFRASLLFTDTDSLVYEIKTVEVYEIFMRIKICLILEIIHEIQSFLILLIKKFLIK